MGLIKTLKLLLDLRRGWKSKTVLFTRVLALLSAIDASFFSGDTGMAIIGAVQKAVSALPFLPPITDAQATSLCMFILAGVVTWLRQHTTEPVDGK